MKKVIDFLIKEWGVEGNTAATLVVTIVIFFLGVVVTLATNYFVNSLRRRAYKIGMKLIIRDFVRSCKKQYETLITKSISQNFMQVDNVVIHLVSNHGLNYLSEMDKKEFVANFYSIWNPRKSKIYSRLFEIVETILVTNKLYIETIKEIMKLFSMHESLFQEGLNGLRRQNDEFIDLLGNKKLNTQIDIEFAEKYFNVFVHFVNEGAGTTISNTNSKIVQPLLSLVRQSPPCLYSQKVIDLCLKSDIAFINMEKLNFVLIEKMQETSNEYKRAFKIGELILSKL